MNILLILFGKLFSKFITWLNLGSGATWPGHIALNINKKFIRETLSNSKIKTIVVAGTNGKTTTSKLIQSILEQNGEKTLHNSSGANLLNGIASTIILNSNIFGKIKKDYAILEVDENTLPQALKEFTPNLLVILNLFRDQLDRYGEVNIIASKWKSAIDRLPNKTTLILNADDPQIAYLGKGRNALYFGLDERTSTKKAESWADTIFCPNCNSNLVFETVYFSHIGKWQCDKCGFKNPNIDLTSSYFPLLGNYNKYNALAATLTSKIVGINNETIEKSLKKFNPAFGRQEKINIKGKKIQIFLSKNPTGFNESLRTVLNAKSMLLVLNDRIPDGRDVSWIWDIDFENLLNATKIVVSGERAFDLGLRIKYAGKKNFAVLENLHRALSKALANTAKNQTLYVLPTYSAMLELRKILTGKKIL